MTYIPPLFILSSRVPFVFVFFPLFTHSLPFCHPFTVVLPVSLCFCLPRRPTWPISAGAANLDEGPSRSLLPVSPVFHYGFFQFSQSVYPPHQGLPAHPVYLLRVCPWNWRPHHHSDLQILLYIEDATIHDAPRELISSNSLLCISFFLPSISLPHTTAVHDILPLFLILTFGYSTHTSDMRIHSSHVFATAGTRCFLFILRRKPHGYYPDPHKSSQV